MNCIICGDSLSLYAQNPKKNPVYQCSKCNLYSVKFSKTLENNDVRDRYQHGDFWENTDYDLEEMIKNDFSDKQGKNYALISKSMYSYCNDLLSGKHTILEIGVGTGVHLIMLDKIGFNVTGIEPDPTCARLVNTKLKKGRCITGFIEDFEIDEKFDVIWLYHVVEHIIRPDFLFEKCFKLLKDDGIVIIAVPDCENQKTLQESITNSDHLWHFSKNSIKKLAIQSGFNVKKCDSLATIKELNAQRIFRYLEKTRLTYLSQKIWPYWPLRLTRGKDGYEIRLVLQKNKNGKF